MSSDYSPNLIIEKDKLLQFINEKESEITTGINSYLELINKINPLDGEYQRKYVRFYRINRNEKWREKYFDLLNEQKEKRKSIDVILSELYDEKLYTRYPCIEISFASKLIATDNANKPVIDKWVLKNLGLYNDWNNTKSQWRKNNTDESKKIEDAKKLYKSVVVWYDSDDAKRLLSDFNEKFPSFKNKLSDTKKIDILLWQYRPKN